LVPPSIRVPAPAFIKANAPLMPPVSSSMLPASVTVQVCAPPRATGTLMVAPVTPVRRVYARHWIVSVGTPAIVSPVPVAVIVSELIVAAELSVTVAAAGGAGVVAPMKTLTSPVETTEIDRFASSHPLLSA